jgi:protein TonB
MNLDRRQNLLIAGFLLLTLLLHLLLLLIPETGLLQPVETKQPVYVERRPPPRRDRELDLPFHPPPPTPRPTPAPRRGPQDQVVERETAPPGEDSEDRVPSRRAPPPQPQPRPAQPRQPAVAPPVAETRRPISPQGDRPAAEPAPAPVPLQPPSLEQLTTLAPRTMARIDSDWRRKLREGVQKGDTVWLDTEQDLLISFFKRFRNNIYNVWNYPERARQRQEEGRCLLRIVVSRQGTIVSVDLLESSGSRDLDEEAMRAVHKGAPYGPLPSSYPHPQLNIMAYFNYSLTRSFIYGERP